MHAAMASAPTRTEPKRPNIVVVLFDWFIAAINAIGTSWIFVIMILINSDVFMRYVFNAPVRGVPLVISLSIIAIVFLQMPDTLKRGRFIRNDALLGKLLRTRPKVGNTLDMIYNAFGAILMGTLVWYEIPFFEKDWNLNTYAGNEGDFTVPLWPIHLMILIGATACGTQYLRDIWRNVRYLRGDRAEAADLREGSYE
jgi:TRAP-type mannitol/chloroaromatic compound transport system permease small subunit